MISNLKIGTRLAIAFSGMIAFLVSCCAIGIIMLGTVNEYTHEIITDNVPKSMTSSAMMDDLNDIALSLRNLLLMDSEEDVARQFEIIANARKKIDDKMSFLSRTVASEDGKAILQRAVNIRDKYVSETDKILAMIRDGKRSEAQSALLSNLRFILADYKKELTAMTAFQSSRMDAKGKASQQSYERSFTLMLALGSVATLLAALMGYWITRSITRPIHEALKVATTVARGDLTSEIEVTTTDETGELLRALKDMNHSLATIVGEVRTSTDAINGASAQIAAGNMDLSSRTEEQASSLEETAASMEQLTSTVKQNAENAQQASQLAATASGVARKGGTVVAQVVDTMQAIAESSGRIVEITGVIEGIAFQTNILALNAAVEAARAGEQGRGFAVVAGEVRTLAQRAAAAAKEIKTLIDDSASKVNAGGKLVGEAGTTMEEIVVSVERVSDLMGEISSATEEQTQGIEQVNEAIAQIDQVTQQNAALVEEASAAAASLQDQAGSLVNAVSVFRLSGASGALHAQPAMRATVTAVAETRHARTGEPQAKPRKPLVSTPVPKPSTVESWEQF